jgi:hypothetical protein
MKKASCYMTPFKAQTRTISELMQMQLLINQQDD